LHPTLNKDYLPKNEFFISGFKSINQLFVKEKGKVVINSNEQVYDEYMKYKDSDLAGADEMASEH
jgi:hypothetical protein